MFESNLLSQINVNTPLPTFVETHLITTLNNTMHEAFVFAYAMLADRYESLTPLVPWTSEMFYALWGTLQWKLLNSVDSTFAEFLFGLKRCIVIQSNSTIKAATTSAGGPPATAASSSGFGQDLAFRPLTRYARLATWLSMILYPYVRRLLRLKYEKLTAGTPDAELERQSLERKYGVLMAIYHKLIVWCYPALHVFCEGSSYVYLLAYMLEKTPYQSLWQRINRIVVKRVTMRDQAAAQANPGAQSVLFVSQLILLVAVLGFRMLEWRRGGNNAGGGTATAEEENREAERVVPRLDVEQQVAASGSPMPEAGKCPICNHLITNAAVNTASGAVCCYPCLQTYVAEHNCCPMTRKPCIPQNIRRLYEM